MNAGEGKSVTGHNLLRSDLTPQKKYTFPFPSPVCIPFLAEPCKSNAEQTVVRAFVLPASPWYVENHHAVCFQVKGFVVCFIVQWRAGHIVVQFFLFHPPCYLDLGGKGRRPIKTKRACACHMCVLSI